MTVVLRALLAVLLLALAAPASAQAPQRVRVELAPQTEGVTPGGSVYVAIKQTIAPGWHTYWRNPGDSGEATRVRWTLPAGWRAGELVWPTPERKRLGPLTNYGYEGEVLLPAPIEAPADAAVGATVRLRADVDLLVCSDICVPETHAAELILPVVAGRPPAHPKFGPAMAETLAAAPKPVGLTAAFRRQGDQITLGVVGPDLAGADLAEAWFYPFDGSALDHSAAQSVERGPEGATLTLAGLPDVASERLDGVLALADGRAFEVQASLGTPPPGAAGLGQPPARAAGDGATILTLPLAALFAFVGGLILNLMPCVFPVLALKAAALASHAHDRRAARAQGLAYGVGVVTTFLVLAGALIAFKAAGQAVGWGFQLQSPPVVAALCLLMVLIAAELAGVTRMGDALSGLGGGRLSDGPAGAWATGALAVVMAAPCTAPFMAGAIGFGLTQSAPVALTVFLALAIGFALPFVLLSVSPALLSRLPKPGRWMVRLRRGLALPMLGAALWLGWVFERQTGDGWVLIGLGLLSTLLMMSVVELRVGKHRRRNLQAALAAGAGLLVLAPFALRDSEPASASERGPALQGDRFSPERLAELRAEGRPVLVNFTADWCVTCKANEAGALSSGRVKRALESAGAAYLVADWTRRDAAIARELSAHGRAGVPLYLVYPAGGAAPEVLPQLLTEGAVEAALRRARGERLAAGTSGGAG